MGKDDKLFLLSPSSHLMLSFTLAFARTFYAPSRYSSYRASVGYLAKFLAFSSQFRIARFAAF